MVEALKQTNHFLPGWSGQVEFTIEGNHTNRKGNPKAYLTRTRKGLWTARAKDYQAWKTYVQTHYRRVDVRIRTAIESAPKIRLDTMIFFANDRRADPENIRKGIQDALFPKKKQGGPDDRHVIGSFDYGYDKERPRVEVAIRALEASIAFRQNPHRPGRRA